MDGELHFFKHFAAVYSRPSLLAVPQGGTILRGLMFGLPTLRMYENLHVVSTHIWDCQPLFQDATKEEAKEEKDQKEALTWGDPKQGALMTKKDQLTIHKQFIWFAKLRSFGFWTTLSHLVVLKMRSSFWGYLLDLPIPETKNPSKTRQT